MIAYLKGHIIAKDEQGIILNVHDVGYQVLCDERSLQTLSGETELFIYHQVREDAEILFGFKTLLDRRVFVSAYDRVRYRAEIGAQFSFRLFCRAADTGHCQGRFECCEQHFRCR